MGTKLKRMGHIDWMYVAEEAQKTIDRLTRENAALRDALRECADWMRANLTDGDLSGIDAYKQARAALALAEEK